MTTLTLFLYLVYTSVLVPVIKARTVTVTKRHIQLVLMQFKNIKVYKEHNSTTRGWEAPRKCPNILMFSTFICCHSIMIVWGNVIRNIKAHKKQWWDWNRQNCLWEDLNIVLNGARFAIRECFPSIPRIFWHFRLFLRRSFWVADSRSSWMKQRHICNYWAHISIGLCLISNIPS
jgi:hypothetical protein